MTILFFTKGDINVGSSRQRVWFLANHLQKRYGVNFEVIHSIKHVTLIPSFTHFKTLKTVYTRLRRTDYDIIVAHKSLFPFDIILLILYAAWRWQKKLVYDLDDAEWIHSRLKSVLFARFAHAVVAGSHAILRWAQQYNTNSIYIPTVLDYDIYHAFTVTHQIRERYTIGWAGLGKAHFKNGSFQVIRDALERLHQKGVCFRFVIIGAQYYEPFKNYFKQCSFPTIFIDWIDTLDVPKMIYQYAFDVGIMPLAKTPFTNAKCAFKAIEYLACSVPAIASPVGENGILVEHGKNGFLADTVEEWISAFETLLSDARLRKMMGETGQKKIRACYSYEAIVPQYYNLLAALSS